jgi:hypothetical protein
MRPISFSADTFKPFLDDDFDADKYAAKLISSIRTYVDPDKREVNRGYELVLAESLSRSPKTSLLLQRGGLIAAAVGHTAT